MILGTVKKMTLPVFSFVEFFFKFYLIHNLRELEHTGQR